MRPKHSEDTKRRAVAIANEVSIAEASRQTGVPRTTINHWVRASRPPEVAVQDTTSSKDIVISGLRAQVEQLKEERKGGVESTWHEREKRNAKHIEKHSDREVVDIEIGDSRPVGICFVSDQHIGAKMCDLQRMRQDAEFIAATDGLYAVLGGDGIDNHILIKSAIIASDSAPDEQYELFDFYLSIFSNSIVAAVCGNHDGLWGTKVSGIDMISRMMEAKRIHYARHQAFLRVSIGGVTYRILCRHTTRYNSSINALHGIKRQWDLGDYDFDIGIAGHVHHPAVEKFMRHKLPRWAAIAGSYQLSSDYSQYGGFPSSVPTCPTFVLFPGKRHIVGFDDVRDAGRFLEAVR